MFASGFGKKLAATRSSEGRRRSPNIYRVVTPEPGTTSAPPLEINPLHMDVATSTRFLSILRKCIAQNPKLAFFKAGPHHLEIDENGEKKQIQLRLTHSVLRRESASVENAYRYEIVGGRIGEGAFSHVYLSLGTLVPQADQSLLLKLPTDSRGFPVKATRVIKEQTPTLPGAHNYIRKEVDFGKILGLDPKAIVDTYNDKVYLVEKLLPGMELLNYFMQEPSLSITVGQRETMSLELLYAVKELHKKRVLHRDLKPDNFIMHRFEDYISMRPIDFNLCRFIDEECRSDYMGTPGYVAPEIHIHKQRATFKSDLYSAAMTIKMIWNGGTPSLATYCNKMECLFINMDEKEISSETKNVIKSLLEKMTEDDPEKRISVDQAIDELQNIILNRLLNDNKLTDPETFKQAFLQGTTARKEIDAADADATQKLIKFIQDNVRDDWNVEQNNIFCKMLSQVCLKNSSNKADMLKRLERTNEIYLKNKQELELKIITLQQKSFADDKTFEKQHISASIKYIKDKCNKSTLRPDEKLELSHKLKKRINIIDKLLATSQCESAMTLRMSR